MQNLLCELESQGLNETQIQSVFFTVHQWLDDHYPVMATISKKTMTQELGIREIELSSYKIVDQHCLVSY
jgi:hypothetical protein